MIYKLSGSNYSVSKSQLSCVLILLSQQNQNLLANCVFIDIVESKYVHSCVIDTSNLRLIIVVDIIHRLNLERLDLEWLNLERFNSNGLNPEWTQPRMDPTLNGLNPEWTQLRMDSTPNGLNPNRLNPDGPNSKWTHPEWT